MAATVILERYTGAGATATAITSGNTTANASDAHQTPAAGSSNPIIIQTSGRGFWVTTGINATVAATTNLNNLRWHMDGTNNFGTGIDLDVGNSPTYDQAVVGGGAGQGAALALHSGIAGIVSGFTHTAGSPRAVSGSAGTSTGRFGDYIVYQITCTAASPPGPTPQEQITWLFDES